MRSLAGAMVVALLGGYGFAGERQEAMAAGPYSDPGGFGVEYGNLVLGGATGAARPASAATAARNISPADRVSLHAGYDFGAALGYAVMTGDRRAVSSAASGDGLFYGVGLALAVSEGLILSGEALRRYGGASTGTGGTGQGQRFSMKVSFRF